VGNRAIYSLSGNKSIEPISRDDFVVIGDTFKRKVHSLSINIINIFINIINISVCDKIILKIFIIFSENLAIAMLFQQF
jgi:hypothetical protein